MNQVTAKSCGSVSHAFFARLSFACVSLFFISTVVVVLATTYARVPKPEELAGVWIGFDEDELSFTRLDLRPDFTGYCARVHPTDTILHEYGVKGYRVTKWGIDKWTFIINLSPMTTNAESIYMRGRHSAFSLRLEVGGTNSKWKRELILRRESRVEGANQETRDMIKELEER
jgi:hypothetical protein